MSYVIWYADVPPYGYRLLADDEVATVGDLAYRGYIGGAWCTVRRGMNIDGCSLDELLDSSSVLALARIKPPSVRRTYSEMFTVKARQLEVYMNKHQREKNRRTARDLAATARKRRLSQHTCENCGEKGDHWISTRGTSLRALITGQDDQDGFWTCPKLYGPDGRRIVSDPELS